MGNQVQRRKSVVVVLSSRNILILARIKIVSLWFFLLCLILSISSPCHGLILYETTLSQEKRNQFGHINISRVMLGSSRPPLIRLSVNCHLLCTAPCFI